MQAYKPLFIATALHSTFYIFSPRLICHSFEKILIILSHDLNHDCFNETFNELAIDLNCCFTKQPVNEPFAFLQEH